MFEPSDQPRLFGIPPGVDFPKALVEGLQTSFKDKPPDALARVQLIVNTRRMARRIRTLFDEGPPVLLPRITLITSFGEDVARGSIPQSVSPVRRQIELSALVRALLTAQPDIAPQTALFVLTQSLAKLMDEMHSEAVLPQDIARIDTGDQSGHWERIKAFLDILKPYFETGQTAPDIETRQRMVIELVARAWRAKPPEHPVLIAGSTGSRGATRLLMKTIAAMPQGAAILPGFDFDQPSQIWDLLMSNEGHEDHPQFRYARLLSELDSGPSDVDHWSAATASTQSRTALVSLALRPAPVTDQWLAEAPGLEQDMPHATRNITLIEAPSARIEALAIAMRLRQAAEDGITAALITPDRTLTRQVGAALARWRIVPDDSAGIPLHQSAPGRFLRHIAETFERKTDAALLLTILKHPLCHSNASRGDHLRFTRELELFLRREGPPYPTADLVNGWAEKRDEDHVQDWAGWLSDTLLKEYSSGSLPLQIRASDLMDRAETLARGAPPDEKSAVWEGDAGQQAWQAVSELRETAADLSTKDGKATLLE
ncbi:MAG: double-strand break repair protein AddB, partial [Pseudomonadota bacterium]